MGRVWSDRGRRSACVLAGSILVLLAAVGAPSFAAGPAGSQVVFSGVRAHVSHAAAIDFAQLARLERLKKRSTGPLVPALMPEPQEKAEPNNRITLPSPFQAPLSPSTATFAASSPSPAASFLAQADAAGGAGLSFIPPDTQGAIGPDKLMVVLNSNYVIQQKSTGAVLGTVSMSAFWGATGAVQPFDPRVVYDPYNGRWIVAAVNDALTATSSILYGVSDTSDPQGTWHLYSLDADATDLTWADFPTIGFNKNVVAIGLNMFTNAPVSSYAQGKLIVLDYNALRANSGAGNPSAINVPGSFTIQPAVTYSSTENTLYLVEHGSSGGGTYNFWTLTGLGPPSLSLVGGAAKSNPLGPWTVPGSANVLPQNGGFPADAADARIGNAVFRNGHIYYAQTVGLPTGLAPGTEARTAVQWVELDTNGNFVQGGRISDPSATSANGGHWYAFPSLSVNAANDVLVGFSEFQSNDFPDAGYAFRAGTDPTNTMRDPVTLKEGEGPYFKTFGGGRNRWGDYSSTQVDPSDDTSMWTVQEYAGSPAGSGDGSGRWSTWWGKVVGGGAAPPPPPLKPPCVVPNVIGMKLTAAKTKIKARQCRLGKVTYVKSTKRKKGRVIKESPKAGRRLGNSSKVNLTLGKGPRRA
jgi:hypothetical protein